ncbi:peptidase M23-like protein [Labedella gwakjiensis]|uniref:Peptidase M23-like protein n=1 Tax=Labedella gwakjiensis TaxID=390269 RepID=A0A2P8GST7_9MICO|nr:M23 family metallopeptidase [Labedella gwakjiensis]PSL37021.1 peptidase M23-like protein [Labedella gwakjiensis]RUQ81822.1 hypothetical protein ELQ93_17475 [Labedella gwakjiensis]
MPASLPGDDAPLRRARQRRSPATTPSEVTPLENEAEERISEKRASGARATDSPTTLRSERRSRRIAPDSELAIAGVASAVQTSAAPVRIDGRRARRAAPVVEPISDVESAPDVVSDWMGAPAAASSAPTRRARRSRDEVVEASTSATEPVDAAEALPVGTRRSRRPQRSVPIADEAVPLLTVEPRVTLEAAPVAANPSDLVVPTDDTDGQPFTIVQDDPADVSSHNAIPDEREAVSVLVEDVPVEPVMATVSPSIVLDPVEASASAVPITVATTTSVTAVAHVTEQDERAIFVPRTEIDPPMVSPAPVAAAAVVSAPARRRRAGRVAAKSFSFAAFSVAGLLTLATSLPANALLSADDVAEQKVLVTQQDTTSTGDTQTVAASGDTALETVQRDTYGAMSAIDAAKALGIQPEATFTNDPNGTIQWPFAVGVHIGSGYGARPGCSIGCSTNHKGQDFNPGYGAPIQSIADGVVVESTDSGGAFGVKIVIEHVIDGQVIHSLYGHMIAGSRTVEVGDPVTVGQVIGQTGNTGRSTGAHLHFEILLNGTDQVDPLAWLYANTN